eukprot:2331516-Pyramimonas_sp.AAC.1
MMEGNRFQMWLSPKRRTHSSQQLPTPTRIEAGSISKRNLPTWIEDGTFSHWGSRLELWPVRADIQTFTLHYEDAQVEGVSDSKRHSRWTLPKTL